MRQLPISAGTHPEFWHDLCTGVRHFDAGQFWEAHEAWEHGWHNCTEFDRDYFKGLIQFTAVQHHLQRQRWSAAQALLDRGRIEHHLLGSGWLDWPMPTTLMVLVAAAQRSRLRSAYRHWHNPRPTHLSLGPWLPDGGSNAL